MSRIMDCSTDENRERAIAAAVDAVKAGRLVVMPTDTVYGLGCDAFDNQAVASLLRAKHRGPDMPVPVLVGSWSTIEGLVREYSPAARTLVEAFWPGGLSLVVNQAPSLPWNLGDTAGTVMLRMPLHPIAIEILRRTGPMRYPARISPARHRPPMPCVPSRCSVGKRLSTSTAAKPRLAPHRRLSISRLRCRGFCAKALCRLRRLPRF